MRMTMDDEYLFGKMTLPVILGPVIEKVRNPRDNIYNSFWEICNLINFHSIIIMQNCNFHTKLHFSNIKNDKLKLAI